MSDTAPTTTAPTTTVQTAAMKPAPTRATSVQRTARTAGFLYLILAVCGGFAEFFVRQALIVRDDAAATANNILASESVFRLGVVGELLGQVVFVMLVLALYRILKHVDRRQAALMVSLVLVAVTITSLNMLNQFAGLYFLGDAGFLQAFDVGQRQALALTFLDLHQAGYFIAQVFFGLWLLPLGNLICKSGFLPRAVGGLLVLAGIGYLVDVVTFFLFPDFGFTVSEFTFLGELALMLWLLVRGVDVPRWERSILRTA
ncbi:MAG: DUF4386 domain-containing protein [Trueperaceae bacterium]